MASSPAAVQAWYRGASKPAASPVTGSSPSMLAPSSSQAISAEARVEEALVAHWGFVGRLLRHWGVQDDLDDAVQQVFITLASKIDSVELGKEKSFLAGCAVHIAARHRRSVSKEAARRGEMPSEPGEVETTPEQDALNRERLRQLDEILGAMSDDTRTVFLLYEVEEMTMQEIAGALEIPQGTVASRLRRARAYFSERVGA